MTNVCCSEIRDNLAYVQENIANAALKAGRKPEEITLVGVTKTQPAEAVRCLIEAGVTTIGENKVQEMLEKLPLLSGLEYSMHLIGHLQRNKAKFLPGKAQMVQSVDSEKLIQALDRAYEGQGGKLDVLLEVNIAAEDSKTGAAKSEVMLLAETVRNSRNLTLRGLMAIPPFGLGEAVRVYFEQMRQLFIDIKAEKMDNENVNILSMGMSDDYEYAILEGSTMVRIGTKLFGPRNC